MVKGRYLTVEPMTHQATYRLLDHTADLGFECEGPTREALFATAAVALADIIARVEPLSAAETVTVEAMAHDDDARLRAFLDEVLFRFETKGFLPKEAAVAIDGDRVKATLRGQTVDLATHPIERVVKAVTYHGLEVEERDGAWWARVILDL
jgi:SHS2 domain-containing protein